MKDPFSMVLRSILYKKCKALLSYSKTTIITSSCSYAVYLVTHIFSSYILIHRERKAGHIPMVTVFGAGHPGLQVLDSNGT